MASATIDSTSDRLQVESIPTLDLRLLSQSELYSLSLCSDGAFDPRRCDDVVIPKIDRSVFNESAGSRKQTYSRLRLAPRKPETASPSAAGATTTTIPSRTPHLRTAKSTADITDDNDPEREENSRIIGILKELFAGKTNGDELIPVRVEYSDSVPEFSNVGHSNVKKRKRGRPRKNDSAVVPAADVALEVEVERGDDVIKDIVVYENVEDRDREIVNKNGVVVDVAALANLEDPYGAELKRRTEGLETEEELLGFLNGVNGQWGSRRKKKRIVDASDFGDVLPKGWNLSLSLKKKVGRVWLFCRRYISPNGRQFASCKEVSSYLLSFIGHQDADPPNYGHSDENILLTYKMASGNAADFVVRENIKRGDLVCYKPSPVTYISNDHETQVTSNIGNPGEVQGEILKCHKCTMIFDEKDDLLHHQLSCHRRKRSRIGTSVTDGLIIKGGIYECQFCHKTFNERNRYNGHVGAHMKNHVKSVEASPRVLSMQNSVDPVLFGGVPPGESMRQTSIGDEGDVAKMFNVKADGELNSDSPPTPTKYYTDSNIGTYTDKFDLELNFLSHNKQDTGADRNEKTLTEESCDKQDTDYKMNNYKLESVDEAAKLNFCLGSEAALSNNKNKGNCESSGETNVLECAATTIKECFVGQERISGSCLTSLYVNEKTGDVKINVNGVSASIEETNQESGAKSGLPTPNDDEKTRGIEKMEDRCFARAKEEFKLDGEKFANNEPMSGFQSSCADQDEDVMTGVKQQSSSDVCSLDPVRNEQRCGNADNNTNWVLTSEGCVLPPSGDKETSGCKDNELRIGFVSSHTGRDEDAGTTINQERSSESRSIVPSWTELCFVENNGNGVSTCIVEETGQEKDSKSSLVILSDYEQTYDVEKNMDEVSTRKMEEPRCDEVQTFRNGELAFRSSHSGLNADVVTSSKQENILEFCSLVPSGNQQKSGVEYVTGVYNSTVVEPDQESSSGSGLLTCFGIGQSCNDVYMASKVTTNSIEEPKPYEVQNFRDTELVLAFGNTNIGLDTDAMSRVGIKQTFCLETNLRVGNNTVEEPQQERGSGSEFLGPSCYGKECDLGNNLNSVYTGRVWERPRIDEIRSSGNDELMIGFGSSSAQPEKDVMTGGIWMTDEENVLQSSLAVNSAPPVQSSSCFPTFHIASDKGENELFRVHEKYDNMSGFEGPRSSGIEHVEFSFLPAQNFPSLQEGPKTLSYDTEMGQGFDSSFWLGKDALSPNIATRNQFTTVCIWCRNELHHNPIQTGAIGSVCPNCNAKISEQFNVL
ncbi:hypothetical protein F0562_035641 [Nyssa sinensis]|uniref:C2H2-type domain-containing protein n=1 Tax=Nyssa sinensis TaxID=561372 RepID=A0A5J5AEW9_9ASTE|nr:hypothetical protein F0562_035641 [Nyssa sinensis]